MKKYGKVDEDFATNLVTWSEVIRKTFFIFDGGVDEVISTRRLDHIIAIWVEIFITQVLVLQSLEIK